MYARVLVFATCVSSVLLACKGADSGEAGDAKSAKSTDAPPAPAKPAPEPEPNAEADGGTEAGATETDTGDEAEAPPPLPESFEKVGVDVCDQYVTDYVACIDSKVAEADREAQRRIVFENIEAWKQMASSGPSAEKGLQTACRIAREQAKRATQDAGCEW